ncbi:MAG: hypothetical protein GY847_01230 [Proteobacteria bacterium]|nr:hypothetical protein [Pseudomonadota bacterium]
MMNISEYFNSTLAKVLATVDEKGQPNVCPCGTANMPDENVIHIGNVCIDQSLENIRKTKKATLMASKPVGPEYWVQYEKTGEKPYPAGYRCYCTLIDETNDQEILKPIYERLKDRVGGKMADKLDSVLIFKIDDIREIDFESTSR